MRGMERTRRSTVGCRYGEKWLDRLLKQLRHEVIVERHFVNERLGDDAMPNVSILCSIRSSNSLGNNMSNAFCELPPYSMPGGGA